MSCLEPPGRTCLYMDIYGNDCKDVSDNLENEPSCGMMSNRLCWGEGIGGRILV